MECECCKIKHDGNYGSGRFCSVKCARKFSTIAKRKEINQRVSTTLKNQHTDTYELIKCPVCGDEVQKLRRRHLTFCSQSCAARANWSKDEYRKSITQSNVERCKSPEERIRLRNVGRVGGFGKKGYTKDGVYFQSTIEKEIFEWLYDNGIDYVPHKPIPNSSKISDAYLPSIDTWVEIDGINREKRQKWLKSEYKYWKDKLETYKREQLKFVVIYSIDDMKKFMDV